MRPFEATPGHAMLVIAAPGKRVEAFGFYPDGVQDETRKGGWERYTRSAVITLNARQYERLRATIHTWREQQYRLTRTDCVGFVFDVLNAAGIQVAERKWLPDDFGEEIVKAHGESWGMCLGRAAVPRPRLK